MRPKGKLKWTLFEFPKYGRAPSFKPLRFYLGLLFPSLSFILGLFDKTTDSIDSANPAIQRSL